jgi:cytochrome P450
VCDEPTILSSIVSETIRLIPSVISAPRTASAPLEICGRERPGGTPVVTTFLTANRDPGVWRDPDVFMPRRFEQPHAPRLLSFGGGPHYCLGAALARATLEETVRGVAALSPRLAADPERLDWRMVIGRSPVSLPVTL